MLERITENPWMFLAMVLTLVVLNLAAWLRIRRDSRKQGRAKVDRRKTQRKGADRRWENNRNRGRV